MFPSINRRIEARTGTLNFSGYPQELRVTFLALVHAIMGTKRPKPKARLLLEHMLRNGDVLDDLAPRQINALRKEFAKVKTGTFRAWLLKCLEKNTKSEGMFI